MSKRTKSQSAHFHYYLDVMRKLEWDLHQPVIDAGHIPEAWHEIAQERGRAPLVKVTLRVEQDVLKFFRSTGRGYQGRMNDVMRSWMHARLAGLVRGPDAAETQAYVSKQDRGRPRVGDAALEEGDYVRQTDGTLLDVRAQSALLDHRMLQAGSVRELLEVKHAVAVERVEATARLLATQRQAVADVKAELERLG